MSDTVKIQWILYQIQMYDKSNINDIMFQRNILSKVVRMCETIIVPRTYSMSYGKEMVMQKHKSCFILLNIK